MIVPMMLAAAAPEEAPLWEVVPVVEMAGRCPLPAASWGKPQPSNVEGWRIVSVIFDEGKLTWDGVPVDEETLRSRARAFPTRKGSPQIYFYAAGDCAEARRLAALIAGEAKCTPRICFASESPLAAVLVAPPRPANYPPAPPAPPAPPPGKKATPRGSPGSWVINDDYPAEALRARQQGTTSFRLDIDDTGRVTDCTVTSSSCSPVLDEAACTLLKQRALFNPAEDARGVKIASTWSSRFRWELPVDPPRERLSWASVGKLTIAEDGTVTDCSDQYFGPPGKPKEDQCANVGHMPLSMRLEMRGNTKGPVTIMFRYEHIVAGAPATGAPRIPAQFRPISVLRISLEVSATGQISKCDAVMTPTAPGVARACEDETAYIPGARPSTVTITQSILTTGDDNPFHLDRPADK